ncbi:hypothetical protein BB560_005763, partial [Smittium megazygosporum]
YNDQSPKGDTGHEKIEVVSSPLIKVETPDFLLSSSPGQDVESMRLQMEWMKICLNNSPILLLIYNFEQIKSKKLIKINKKYKKPKNNQTNLYEFVDFPSKKLNLTNKNKLLLWNIDELSLDKVRKHLKHVVKDTYKQFKVKQYNKNYRFEITKKDNKMIDLSKINIKSLTKSSDATESAELPLLENVRKMHSACKSRPGISLSVLAMVFLVYTIQQLKDFGFEFSSNQYSLSRKKASDESFTLVDYERHSPTSKTKVSDETKTKVSNILHEFSNSSSSTISLGTAENGYQIIRYLTRPKRDIYDESKAKHLGMQFSPSEFYSLCPNNYRKLQKRTDACNVCDAREKIKKYDAAKGNENASLEQIMRLRIATEKFQVHKRLALGQRKNFKSQITGLSADFKENFKIGGGPIETTRDFYQKSQISDLCFCVMSKSGNQIQRRYYSYLSENLSYDLHYVINCLKDLLCRSESQEFEEVNLWSDSGPHFKNADYLYSMCLELPQIFSSKKFKLNYFMENHGKSDVDGHFGVLSR